MTIQFLRNKLVEVEPLSDGQVGVRWSVADDIFKAEVNIKVRPPDLEITELTGRVDRCPHQKCIEAPDLLEDAEGVLIGGGLRKIVKGTLAGPDGCMEMSNAVLECCNAVILHFTRPRIEAGEGQELELSEEERNARAREMLKINPRLIRSCIVYQDDSPIMKGFDFNEKKGGQ
jgi:hypothetical protein